MQIRFHYHREAGARVIGVTYARAGLEHELKQLRERAFRDRLTGLPNAHALEDELACHRQTSPFSILVIDFDGMRSANAAFGFSDGGDVLIAAVGRALAGMVQPGEFAARMHTAGDEFAVLLPHTAEHAGRRRAREVERSLDLLAIPQTHRSVYRGASVGVATRRVGETAGQTLGRAIDAMRKRKRTRQLGPGPSHKTKKTKTRPDAVVLADLTSPDRVRTQPAGHHCPRPAGHHRRAGRRNLRSRTSGRARWSKCTTATATAARYFFRINNRERPDVAACHRVQAAAMPSKGVGCVRHPVPVSLRECSSGVAHFFGEYEIELADGAVQPIEHAGRRFLFSHTASIGDYASAARDQLYVFTEAEPLG